MLLTAILNIGNGANFTSPTTGGEPDTETHRKSTGGGLMWTENIVSFPQFFYFKFCFYESGEHLTNLFSSLIARICFCPLLSNFKYNLFVFLINSLFLDVSVEYKTVVQNIL